VLPHDGANHEKVIAVTYESSIQQAGFETQVIPNQGRAAAKMRIEAAGGCSRAAGSTDTTEPGREALGWYHEKKSDDEREVGLGPEHDWSSHGADAFGLMAVAYEDPAGKKSFSRKLEYSNAGIA
jgi:phage terminase large subunit